eukprot:CAMPEP_0206330544 /NCGR_PEP_ID=MMETSP0106_2-20121207/23774_1 /ASSEMBLY_ACC=CAM_ASM_000206 /TAXON_ID=81532 /ORGANISM="Acanthoeca-like sp., Strain 10tr" /LENGTH=76 /DNA_ID=CAMNT_0053763307 /DNA_START=541 /DNA_END=771 /DNA_ORIENTATION=+
MYQRDEVSVDVHEKAIHLVDLCAHKTGNSAHTSANSYSTSGLQPCVHGRRLATSFGVHELWNAFSNDFDLLCKLNH